MGDHFLGLGWIKPAVERREADELEVTKCGTMSYCWPKECLGLAGWDQWIAVPSEFAAFAATSITQMGLVHFAASDD